MKRGLFPATEVRLYLRIGLVAQEIVTGEFIECNFKIRIEQTHQFVTMFFKKVPSLSTDVLLEHCKHKHESC